MRRLAKAITVLAIVIPLQGAIASSDSTSGTEVAFYDPAASSWQVPGQVPFYYGAPGDTPLLCDWDGDGKATVGVYREANGYLLLQDENSTGAADYEFFYGIPGDRPLCGDWDGDGTDTIGVFRPSNQTFYLRNHNSQGFGDWSFEYGFASGIPFAGDFNGDSKDTIGLRDPKNGFVSLARSLFTDQPVMEAYFGSAADTLVVGDWDGDGTDRLAVYQPATNTLAVTNIFGSTKVAHVYDLGNINGIPLAAEFDPASGVATHTPQWKGTPPTVVATKPVTEAKPPTPAPAVQQPPAQLPPTSEPPTPDPATPAPPAEQPPAEEPPAQAPPAPPVETPPTLAFGPGDAVLIGTLVSSWDIRPQTAGQNNGPRHAFPFTAPRTGTLDQLALHWVFDNTNYYGGDGGHYQTAIYRDNNGQPDIAGGVIGSAVDWGDGNIPGTWKPWEFGGGGTYVGHRSGLAASVTADTTYWVVTKNIDSGGWTGINAVARATTPSPVDVTPPGVDVSRVYLETGAGTNTFNHWVYPNEPDGHAAMYELVYADAFTFGQGWIHGGDNRFAETISGSTTIVQTFEVHDLPVTTNSLWVHVASGSGTMTATMNGQSVVSTRSGSGWLEFPIITTLGTGTNSFTLTSNGSHTLGAHLSTGGWDSDRTGGYANYAGTGGWKFWGGVEQTGQLGFAIEGASI